MNYKKERVKKIEWNWKEKTIEEFKEFNHLRIKLQSNKNMTG